MTSIGTTSLSFSRSLAQFRSLAGSADRLTVAHFWADWAEQCRPVDEAFKIMANDEKNKNKIAFVR